MTRGDATREHRCTSPGCAARARADSGFTLVDLVIVIAIAAVLASLAASPFSAFIAGQRASAAAVDLYAALNMARSEATKRSTNVTLSPIGNHWKNGWVIRDPGDGDIKVLEHGALSGAEIDGPAQVVYQRSGRVRAPAPSFELTMTSGAATAKRCVRTDLSGRPYIVQAC